MTDAWFDEYLFQVSVSAECAEYLAFPSFPPWWALGEVDWRASRLAGMGRRLDMVGWSLLTLLGRVEPAEAQERSVVLRGKVVHGCGADAPDAELKCRYVEIQPIKGDDECMDLGYPIICGSFRVRVS